MDDFFPHASSFSISDLGMICCREGFSNQVGYDLVLGTDPELILPEQCSIPDSMREQLFAWLWQLIGRRQRWQQQQLRLAVVVLKNNILSETGAGDRKWNQFDKPLRLLASVRNCDKDVKMITSKGNFRNGASFEACRAYIILRFGWGGEASKSNLSILNETRPELLLIVGTDSPRLPPTGKLLVASIPSQIACTAKNIVACLELVRVVLHRCHRHHANPRNHHQ